MKIIITEGKIQIIALQWLCDKFCDLESASAGSNTYYFYEQAVVMKKHQVHAYIIVYIDYDHIWKFMAEVFGLEHDDIVATILDWLEMCYGIKDTAILKSIGLNTGGALEYEQNRQR